MTDTFDVSSILWNDVATDHDAVARRGLVVRAKVALAGSWPFLAAATDEADFTTRLALISDQIESRTPPEVLQEVVAGLKRDWEGIRAQATKVASLRREAALHIEAKEGEESLPQAYVHVHKHAGDSAEDSVYQVDHVASPTFIHTLGHWTDHDDAMDRAREYGLPHGLPIYENGRFVEARRLRELFAPDEEFFDHKTGQWIPVNRIPNVEGGAPFTAAYQPDPDAAWRYHSYPPPQPVPGQGGQPTADGQQGVAYPIGPANNGPDGFPADVAEGEQRSQEAYQRQLTPGAWTVTPGTEWPTRPNAGSPDMTPVYASRILPTSGHGNTPYMYGYGPQPGTQRTAVDHHDWEDYERSTSDDFNGSDAPYWKCKDCGSGNYSRGTTCNNCGQKNMNRSAVQHQATEGIVPTPGPNPNYFSQGTQGLQGPAQFPENPSGSIEPKTDNHVDDVYGDVPPQMSSGSASDGTNDGGGYSRQGVNAKLSMRTAQGGFAVDMIDGRDQFQVGWWPDRDTAVREGERYYDRYTRGRLGFSEASVRHTAPGGGEHAPYRIVQENGRFFVENDKGERKEKKGYSSKDEAREHQKALYANVPGASESAEKTSGRHIDPEDRPTHEEAERDDYETMSPEDQREYDRQWGWNGVRPKGGRPRTGSYRDDYLLGHDHAMAGHGEFDRVGQPSQGYLDGHAVGTAAYEDLDPEDRAWHDQQTGRRHASTDPERDAARDKEVASVEKWVAGMSPEERRQRLQGNWPPKQAATDGKIVGLCDHCHGPVRFHTEGGGHLRHLHNGSPKCNDSGSKTAALMQFLPAKIANEADFFRATPGAQGDCDFCGRMATDTLHQVTNGKMHPIAKACREHAKQYDEKRVASLFFQGAVLENPSAANPTGKGGDPYRARTAWEGFESQRPRQKIEGEGGMNSNTPTTAPDPIKTGPNVNSPTPGGDDDDQDNGPRDRDDEDE